MTPIPPTLLPHILIAVRIHADEMVKTANTRQQMIDEGVSFLIDDALEREATQIAYLLTSAQSLLDWVQAFPVSVQPEPSSSPHNPNGLTTDQVGVSEGWRLLNENENLSWEESTTLIQFWYDSHFSTDSIRGGFSHCTYRTKLTCEELKQKRGLT